MAFFARYKTACYVGLALIAGFVAYLAYDTGMCFGSADYTVEFDGFGSSHRGVCLGCKSFYLRKGQTLKVSYDVEIRRGYLHLHLINRSAPFMKGTVRSDYAKTSGKGDFIVPIRESGWYVIRIDGSPDGRGYDLDYTASWHATQAP